MLTYVGNCAPPQIRFPRSDIARLTNLFIIIIIIIKEKRRGKLTHVPLLLHDNAPAHRSHVGQAAVIQCVIHHILLTWHQVITICFQI